MCTRSGTLTVETSLVRFFSATDYWAHFMMARAEELAAIQHAFLESFEIEIDNGRDEERDELRNNQTTDDNQSERPA